MDEKISDSIVCSYISSMRQAAEQSLKSLDGSINWAITNTMATLAFSINIIIEKTPAEKNMWVLLSILAACMALQFHFAIRSAKNYLNILRFSKLEREAVKFAFQLGSRNPLRLKEAIAEYHVEWKSPVTIGCIAKKVVFEFGFFYMGIISLLLFLFIAVKFPSEKIYAPVIALLIVLISAICELFMFSHSPYIRSISLDKDTQAKS